MKTTTSIALGTDGTIVFDEVVVSVEWNSSLQSLTFGVLGAYDYVGDNKILARFEPAIEAALEAKLNADHDKIDALEREFNESSDAEWLAA